MADTSAITPLVDRTRREGGRLWRWFVDRWRSSRRFRRLLYLAAAAVVAFFVLLVVLTRDLPSADKLLTYEPPLPTVVRGVDGEIVGSYARERRVQLRFVDFPKMLTNAFLAAEDKTFWSHGGIDYTGLVGAVFDYATKLGSGARAKGGSTITQQVAKNILVGDEYSIARKLREMYLATRIEKVLTKEQILELYLNEIPLGRQSFGVQAAARAYFDKDLKDLQLHEAAFLAILPKAPERYGRAKNVGLAIGRRNFVLDQMYDNEWITAAQRDQAKAQPLGIIPRRAEQAGADAGYFLEEVRRQLIGRYGEKAEDGPHSVYAGGLWVRSSLDTELQDSARDSLRAGLLRYHAGKGWRGPIVHFDVADGKWQTQLIVSNIGIRYKDWRIGVVTERSGSSARIGFPDGKTYPLGSLPNDLRAGDVIAAAPNGSSRYEVRIVPEVSGGMVVENPDTGRVLAMQGGFDSRLGSFNRATQAARQPGSTIKPFVYATGLDNGMTPASMIPDATFCVYQGSAGEKCFRNFGGGGGGGTHTMRWGLEQSRNLMTVRIANDAGMNNVVRTYKRMGIGEYEPYLSMALGAGDTTVLRMTNAYAALANHGRLHTPSMIDLIQDRNGKIIWRADKRTCTTCNMAQWDGKAMPRLKPTGAQRMDPRTAYQVVHMLEGVVQRGTAVVLRDLKLPLFGKTGTTSGPRDVWFIGGSADIVAGTYLGYDQPRSLGGYAQGGRLAAPIFKQLVTETRERWHDTPPLAPAGVRMVRVDRSSGRKVFAGEPGSDPKAAIIWEAFKPDTEPKRTIRGEEIDAKDRVMAAVERVRASRSRRSSGAAQGGESQTDFISDQGGIY
ncbi:MAG: transglycosylase domain-containing protein [Novosphingobium sp.]